MPDPPLLPPKDNRPGQSMFVASKSSYDSKQVQSVINNLEFLTHKTNKEGSKCLREEGPTKSERMNRIETLVMLANQNLEDSSQLTLDVLLENPKQISFNLMKLDMQQSCRALCDIQRVETSENTKNLHIIANSTDALEVQALKQRKALIPKSDLAPKGVSSKDYQNV